MSFIKRLPEKASEFVVTRYPLWMAFVLLMMISDQEDQDKAALPARLLYANIGMTLFCGFTLSMAHLSSKMSLVFAGQLGYQAYNLVSNTAFRLEDFLCYRLASRNVGLMAVYTLYAYYADAKQKKRGGSGGSNNNNNSGGSTKVAFHLMGHFLLSFFFGVFACLLKYDEGEKEAFLLHVGSGSVEGSGIRSAEGSLGTEHFLLDVVFYSCVVLAGIFLSRKLSKYSFKAALLIMLLYTFYIDCDIAFWTSYSSPASTSSSSSPPTPTGVSLWMQIKLISDNVAIMAALLLFDLSLGKIKTD